MAEKQKKTIQFFYNTGLLGSATPPANIVGTQNPALSPLDIVYFTSEIELWKVLQVQLDYSVIPTIVPNPTGLEQNTLEFQLECDFHINRIGRAYEPAFLFGGSSRVNADRFRKLKFSRDRLVYNFRDSNLFAQGMQTFRLRYFCKTSGTGSVGINLEFSFTVLIEEV